MNSLLLGVQTDWPDFFLWNCLEEVLLVIFLFELLVRVKRHKWRFFTDAAEIPWNFLDTMIVTALWCCAAVYVLVVKARLGLALSELI